MRHHFALRLAATFLAATTTIVAAQAPPSLADVAKARADVATADPSLTSDLTTGKPQVTLLSDSDNTTASGEIGVGLSDVTRLVFRVEAPIQKGAPETTFADLDGLRGGTVATAGLTRYFLRIGNLVSLDPVCRAYNKSTARPVQPISIPAGECTLDTLESRDEDLASAARQAVRNALLEVCREREAQGLGRLSSPNCSVDSLTNAGSPWAAKAAEGKKKALEAACKQYNTTSEPIDIAAGDCDYETLLQKGGPVWADRAIAAVGLRPTIIFSIKGSVQNDRFKVAEPPALDKTTVSKNSTSLRASLGAVLRPSTYVGASFRLERAFEGAPATQVCSPIPDTASLACSSVALSQPTAANRQVIQGEFRLFPTDWLGLNPKVTHDFDTRVTGYQLVAYFLTSKKAGLNGGIDLGYRSDEKKLGARAFIGATFGVVP